jgi:glycosyltransferase involved in cell wall biosynthesis
MNVLVISHTYIAAINREKWRILAACNPDVHVTVVFPTTWPSCLFSHQISTADVAADNVKNCTFIPLPALWTGNEVKYFYLPLQLMRVLKSCKPDVIHVEQGVCALSYLQVIFFAKLLRVKARFIFFTWINWEVKRSLSHRLIWQRVEHLNAYFSNGALAGNQKAKEILQKNGFNKPITVLPQLGVDTKIFYPQVETNSACEQKILYVGRIIVEKGIFLLLNAFATLSKQFPEWHLIFVGKGPDLEKLKQEIKDLNLEDIVKVFDPVAHEQIAPLLRSADILVLPSYDTDEWKEQFGHVLIEAMACKVPVLGSTGGEIPHVIADAGLVFEQKNEADLREKLGLLMQDNGLPKLLGEKGYKRVMKLYSHEAIARATIKVWDSMMNVIRSFDSSARGE